MGSGAGWMRAHREQEWMKEGTTEEDEEEGERDTTGEKSGRGVGEEGEGLQGKRGWG